MDRNQQARQQFQMQQELRKFVQAFQAGQTAPVDRFGNRIAAGALVVWKPPIDMVYQVTDVKPVLDPRAAGWVTLTLQLTSPVNVMSGRPTDSLIIVGHVEDAKPQAPELPQESPVAVSEAPDAPVDPPLDVADDAADADAARERLSALRASVVHKIGGAE